MGKQLFLNSHRYLVAPHTIIIFLEKLNFLYPRTIKFAPIFQSPTINWPVAIEVLRPRRSTDNFLRLSAFLCGYFLSIRDIQTHNTNENLFLLNFADNFLS
jgi:hypothetical protein